MEDKTIEELEKIGDAEALCEIGKRYYYGESVDKDYKKAFEIFKELVDKYNDKDSMGYLVALYFYGNGVEKDYEKAKVYAEILEKEEDLYSIAILGDMYYFGKGVDVNYNLARKYYEKSLDGKYDATYYRLGKIYEEGLECEKNEEKANEYFNKVEKDIFEITIYAMLALNEEKDFSFDIILQYTEMDFKFFIDWIDSFPDKHPCRVYLKKLKSLKSTEYRDIADKFIEKIKKYAKDNKFDSNFTSEEDVDKYVSDIMD